MLPSVVYFSADDLHHNTVIDDAIACAFLAGNNHSCFITKESDNKSALLGIYQESITV